MFLPRQFIPGISGIIEEEELEKYMENNELTERLRRSLYYGKLPTTDRPSLPVTEIAVEFFQDAAPRGLGRVDTFIASSYGRRACMSPCAMMLGMLYIERLKKRNPEYLRNVSSSDLFLISMMMASKYLYDEGVDEEVFNDEWAESANMDLEQLNELERNFLKAIDWSLFVQPEDFWRMLHKVERRIAWEKGREHGAFNYSDLMVLSEHGLLLKTICAFMLEVSKVVLVCSVAYVAGVMTIVGSTASVMYVREQLPAPDRLTLPAAIPSWEAVFRLLPRPGLTHNHDQDQEIFQPQSTTTADDENSDSAQNETSWQQQQERMESNTTTEKTTSRNKKTDFRHSQQLHQSSYFRFPGLLTLVMLKDTVLSFASNLASRAASERRFTASSQKQDTVLDDPDFEDDQMLEGDNDKPNVLCSCGCCDHDSGYEKLCYNLSLSGFTHSANRNSKPNGVKQGQDMETTDCPVDLGCQCCCAISPPHEHPAPDPTALWKWTVPWHRVEEPFAGLTYGFRTSPSIAAAAG